MKKIFFLFSLFAFVFPLPAQNISDFFFYLPNDYLSQLNQAQRMELLTNQDKSDSVVINNYGGKARLLTLDNERNYIKIQTSEQGFFEAKKWTLKDSSSLFAMSFWVCSPACDGGISFFKNNYTPLMFDKNQFPSVEISDFFDRDSLAAKEISEADFKNRFDIFFVRFELQPNSCDILVINDNRTYMNQEDYQKLKPFLKGDCLTLIWKEGRFEKGKVYFLEKIK
ncbi:MAG: DUF3256 family protein [Prevotellaceae bacterium]|jgi:hypothetical protein|nr:DUF3256 family protein [Prevotellaceae bacterium]